jgi:hypothetical protein
MVSFKRKILFLPIFLFPNFQNIMILCLYIFFPLLILGLTNPTPLKNNLVLEICKKEDIGRVIKCSCDTVGRRGDLAKVAPWRRLGLGRAEGVSVA